MAFKKLKYWFDRELAERLAADIQVIHPAFNAPGFVSTVDQQVQPLELKDRVEIFADELNRHLTQRYDHDIHILTQILGPENTDETGMFTNYYWIMPIAKYVEKYGLHYFDLSIKAIEEITKRNTGEYTIRPFIELDQERTLAVMLNWSKSDNFHLRRLASEGGRPRLPWATKLQRFIDDPQPLIPILSNLKDDPSKYVQKSVANCLNDILKDNPTVGRQIIETWSQEQGSHHRRWIIKHALRNLLKNNDSWAKTMVEG